MLKDPTKELVIIKGYKTNTWDELTDQAHIPHELVDIDLNMNNYIYEIDSRDWNKVSKILKQIKGDKK